MKQWKRNHRHLKISRLAILKIIFLLLAAVLVRRIWQLQIVEGKTYKESFILKTTKTLTQAAPRGNIYDRNGKLLASSRLVYTITITDSGSYETDRERQLTLNGNIHRLQKKMQVLGGSLKTGLKIAADEKEGYIYTVDGSLLLRFRADIFGLKDPADLTEEQKNMTAEEMIDYLAGNQKFALYGWGKEDYTEKELLEYGLEKEYSRQEVLEILGVRYMLWLNSYKKYEPAVIAEDVSEELAAYVKEHSDTLGGIGIGTDWERVYESPKAMSHILGYTGKIFTDELEAFLENGQEYSVDDTVGKAGMEQYLEEELRGTDGQMEVVVNNVGKVIGEEKRVAETVSGGDVYLTIDKDLQEAVYQMIEEKLAGILMDNLINARTFDKTRITDSTQIRIPVYDVYTALIENEVLKIADMKQENASYEEKSLIQKLNRKKRTVLDAIETDLKKGDRTFGQLSEEMQEYETIAVLNSRILSQDAVDKTDALYKSWQEEGSISTREFLRGAIEKGWISPGILDEDRYLTSEEICLYALERIQEALMEQEDFEKLVLSHMILKDEISGREVCLLLYRQGILSEKDKDYNLLKNGKLSTFSFVKKKIKNLELTPAMLGLDPCSGSAVVVQQGTGEVLACVSYPGYDSNRLAEPMDSEYYNELLKDRSLPLYNRASQQMTAPGSAFKPVTVAAGIQEGVITANTQMICDGVFDKLKPDLRCWKHSGHGSIVNAASAIQNSCNDYLCDISWRLGTRNQASYNDSQALSYLQKYASLFGLDEKSGIELTESQPHVTKDYGIQSAIGQGTHNYTTTQLAKYVSTLALQGREIPLTLISEKNAGIKKKETIELSEETWMAISQGMRQFAQYNSVLKGMDLDVAGKTGTAQEVKTRPDHALFIGYAPADTPEIAIAVRIANGYSSTNATAVGRDIFNYYFDLEEKETVITGQASGASNMRAD